MSKKLSIDTIDTIKFRTYSGMIALLYLFYILTFFGIYFVNPKYIRLMSIAIQLFICLFLMWSFNPYIKQELRIYDEQIIFAAAFFLLNNVVITEIVSFFNIPIQKYIDPIKRKIIGSVASQPDKPTTSQPDKPTTSQSDKPTASQPTKPTASQPTKPTASQPTKTSQDTIEPAIQTSKNNLLQPY